jgi:hypothetical protein
MKKLWIIAMAFVSTIALAQHDQKQTTTSTESRSSQEEKTKTSGSSYSNEGTIDGASYKITFTAKAATPDKSKDQSGMNSPEKMNNMDQKGRTGTPSIGTSNTTNNQNPAETTSSQAQSTQSNNNTGETSNTGTNVSSGQPGTENQNTGNTPGSQSQPGQSGSYSNQNSILGNPSENTMQNNTANADFSSLDGKTMVVTFKNGKIEFADKGKSSDSGSKSNNKPEPGMAMSNSDANSDNIQSETCEYHKTSGNGSLCTLTASCTGTASEKLYWSAYIDGSKIKGSVLTTANGGNSDYTFTGKRISVSGSKNTSKETSQR